MGDNGKGIWFLQILLIFLLLPIILTSFFLDTAFILSWLPIYLSRTSSKNNHEVSTSFKITYATHIQNISQFKIITNDSSILNSFKSQLHLIETSTITVKFSEFLPSSSVECDYDTRQMTGDRYRIEIQVTDYLEEISSNIERYSSLTLPFTLSNDSQISIPMVLCKLETDSSVITVLSVCQIIKNRIGLSSQMFFPSDSGYNTTIIRYGASSIIPSTCSVEPGTAEDISIILKILGQYRVPFGIKGGGHSLNPGFSSTTGVQISMTRFRKLQYHSTNQTVDIGAGLLWGDVYTGLQSHNITVIGGRVATVGVAGLILGGGYSWKSNQYGLSIDHVLEYQLVSPNGSIVIVNNNSYPDIFFGLKGGLNNFGIVTNFNMRSIPQTQVYGGMLVYTPSQFSALIPALVKFAAQTDPKAQITGSFVIAPGQFLFVIVAFYDAPKAPKGIFDDFLAIYPLGSLRRQSYLSIVKSVPADQVANLRSRYATFSTINITARFLNGLIDRMKYVNSTLGSKLGAYFIFDITPFTSDIFKNSQDGAYPHSPSSSPLLPFLIQFCWTLPSDDEIFLAELQSTRDALFQIVLDEGQNVAGSKQIQYSNYALDDTPLSQLFGNNLARLQSIRQMWDPENVMYLTGGFKL